MTRKHHEELSRQCAFALRKHCTRNNDDDVRAARTQPARVFLSCLLFPPFSQQLLLHAA